MRVPRGVRVVGSRPLRRFHRYRGGVVYLPGFRGNISGYLMVNLFVRGLLLFHGRFLSCVHVVLQRHLTRFKSNMFKECYLARLSRPMRYSLVPILSVVLNLARRLSFFL